MMTMMIMIMIMITTMTTMTMMTTMNNKGINKYAAHRSRSENDNPGNSEIMLRRSTPDCRDPTATQSSQKIIQPLDPTNQHKTTRKHKQNSTSGPLK